MVDHDLFLQGRRGEVFLCIQRILIPHIHLLPVQVRKKNEERINEFLGKRPRRDRLKLAAFLTLISTSALIFKGRTFLSLSEDDQGRLLMKFFDSPLPIIRKGFWGLNTIAKLGVYTQREIYPVIHYEQKTL